MAGTLAELVLEGTHITKHARVAIATFVQHVHPEFLFLCVNLCSKLHLHVEIVDALFMEGIGDGLRTILSDTTTTAHGAQGEFTWKLA